MKLPSPDAGTPLASDDVASWRQAGLTGRRALPAAVRAEASARIRDRLEEVILPRLGRPGEIAFYRPLPDEPDFNGFAQPLWRAGSKTCFPRMQGADQLQMHRVDADLGAKAWVKGPFGIVEPPASAPVVGPAALDVVFVPGVAFALEGERIGMGAGFYDRYLERCPRALRIAVAFECQVFARLPQESWDQRVDWIITESRWIDCGGDRSEGV